MTINKLTMISFVRQRGCLRHWPTKPSGAPEVAAAPLAARANPARRLLPGAAPSGLGPRLGGRCQTRWARQSLRAKVWAPVGCRLISGQQTVRRRARLVSLRPPRRPLVCIDSRSSCALQNCILFSGAIKFECEILARPVDGNGKLIKGNYPLAGGCIFGAREPLHANQDSGASERAPRQQ